MNRPDTSPQKHEHPFQMNKRGRRIVGTLAVGALIVGGALIGNTKNTHAEPVKPLTDEQIFDKQINDAIERGPIDTSNVLGTYAVKQDRTIANAMIQEAALAGRPIDLKRSDDLISVTLSANAFAKTHGLSYSPEDEFVLFEQDVNNNGTKEILATSIDSTK